MKIANFYLLIVALCIFSIQCASGYKAINPASLNYKSPNASESVAVDYKYNLMSKKYAKKEDKKNLSIVAIQITNNTESDLIGGQNLRLVNSTGNPLNRVSNDVAYAQLKQSTPVYLLYLLLTPLRLDINTGTSSSSTPIGYGVGPGITALNMITAGSANGKFKEELATYNFDGMTIKPGETVHCIIGINSSDSGEIQAEISE